MSKSRFARCSPFFTSETIYNSSFVEQWTLEVIFTPQSKFSNLYNLLKHVLYLTASPLDWLFGTFSWILWNWIFFVKSKSFSSFKDLLWNCYTKNHVIIYIICSSVVVSIPACQVQGPGFKSMQEQLFFTFFHRKDFPSKSLKLKGERTFTVGINSKTHFLRNFFLNLIFSTTFLFNQL